MPPVEFLATSLSNLVTLRTFVPAAMNMQNKFPFVSAFLLFVPVLANGRFSSCFVRKEHRHSTVCVFRAPAIRARGGFTAASAASTASKLSSSTRHQEVFCLVSASMRWRIVTAFTAPNRLHEARAVLGQSSLWAWLFIPSLSWQFMANAFVS